MFVWQFAVAKAASVASSPTASSAKLACKKTGEPHGVSFLAREVVLP